MSLLKVFDEFLEDTITELMDAANSERNLVRACKIDRHTESIEWLQRRWKKHKEEYDLENYKGPEADQEG